MFSSVEIPVAGEVIEASRRRPYIVLVLDVEPASVFDLVTASRDGARSKEGARAGIFVDEDAQMTEAFVRLLRATREPTDALVLGPLVVREIVYRLLRGRYGASVREIGVADSQTQRIASVIEHLKRAYAQPLEIASLARIAGMSESSFYVHFRNVTTLTPLQYQKHLRLQEARRLLLTTGTSAADAAYRVGYESASQFSREYARHFGRPPIADTRSSPMTPSRSEPRRTTQR